MNMTELEYPNLPGSINEEKLPRHMQRALEVARTARHNKKRYDKNLVAVRAMAEEWIPAIPMIAVAMAVLSSLTSLFGFDWVIDAEVMRFAFAAVYVASVMLLTAAGWKSTFEFHKRQAMPLAGILAAGVALILQAAPLFVSIVVYTVSMLLGAWWIVPQSGLAPAQRMAAEGAAHKLKDPRMPVLLVLSDCIVSLNARAKLVLTMRNLVDAGYNVPEFVEQEGELRNLCNAVGEKFDYIDRALTEGKLGEVQSVSPDALAALESVSTLRARLDAVQQDVVDRIRAQAEVANLSSPS